jgi:hypothetical protein
MSEQSDTPRTDAELWTSVDIETGKSSGSLTIVGADFARQLERELAAARAETTLSMLGMIADRDRLAAEVEKWKSIADPSIPNRR